MYRVCTGGVYLPECTRRSMYRGVHLPRVHREGIYGEGYPPRVHREAYIPPREAIMEE